MMGDLLGNSRVSSQNKTMRAWPFGSSLASSSIGTPKFSRESNSMMGDPLASSRKQNHEGVVGAQSEQYGVTAESSLGCGGGPGRDVTKCKSPDHALMALFLGTHTRTSQLVTHPGITLARSRLTSEFLRNPKSVSSQKACAIWR
ncbi:hypothetical protein DVH24_034146 [Malus domestica]|uniref:Uncharacterized protein n=1 Tax=Malus domestica TaxID=3750 RepID=A0A498I7S7_MALDO|nr:hypothetical protein DVH24_034146 [Malus domestica]